MPAAYTNLYVEQGTTFTTNITLDDVYGNLYDIHSMTVAGTIRKSYYSANATAVFTTNIDVAASTINLSLPASVTANIAPGRYVYDTVLSDVGTGNKTRILEGVLEVSPDVTR
jgi:hypothetical protein